MLLLSREHEDIVRIISARKVNKSEMEIYERGIVFIYCANTNIIPENGQMGYGGGIIVY